MSFLFFTALFISSSLLVSASSANDFDLPQLCKSLSQIRYDVFPLSTAINRRSCTGSRKICIAFTMFSSNDFAKAADDLMAKIGCIEDVEPTMKSQVELCSALAQLPDSTQDSLDEFFGAKSQKSPLRPLLEKMQAQIALWMAPIIEKMC